jgi:hypothetical protein
LVAAVRVADFLATLFVGVLFFAAVFFAAVFFAAVFFAAVFFVAVFFVAVLFVAVFFAVAFLAGALAADLVAAVFFAGVCFAALFFAAAVFAAAVFAAAVFAAVVFFAAVFAGARFAADFLGGAVEAAFRPVVRVVVVCFAVFVAFFAVDADGVDLLVGVAARRLTPAVTLFAAAAVRPAIFFAVVRAMTRGPLKMRRNCGQRHIACGEDMPQTGSRQPTARASRPENHHKTGVCDGDE